MALTENVRTFLIIVAIAVAISGFGVWSFQALDDRPPPREELIPFSGMLLDTTFRECAYKRSAGRSSSCRDVTALRIALQDGIATVHVAAPPRAIHVLRNTDVQGKRVDGLAGRACYNVQEYCVYELNVGGAPLFTHAQLERDSANFRRFGYGVFGTISIAMVVATYFLVLMQRAPAPANPPRVKRRAKQDAPRRLKRRID